MTAHRRRRPKPSATPIGAASRSIKRGATSRRRAPSPVNPLQDNLYNLGNALALQGDLRGALKAYEESLTQDPDAKDAIANRDFIQSLLDQQEQEQQDQVKVSNRTRKVKNPSRARTVSRNPAIRLNPPSKMSNPIAMSPATRALTARTTRTNKSNSQNNRTPIWPTPRTSIQRL